MDHCIGEVGLQSVVLKQFEDRGAHCQRPGCLLKTQLSSSRNPYANFRKSLLALKNTARNPIGHMRLFGHGQSLHIFHTPLDMSRSSCPIGQQGTVNRAAKRQLSRIVWLTLWRAKNIAVFGRFNLRQIQ